MRLIFFCLSICFSVCAKCQQPMFHGHNIIPFGFDTSNLRLWLKFDEGTGANPADATGLLPLGAAGGNTWGTPKVGSSAIYFNGTGQAIFNQAAWLSPEAGDFSISAWVYPTTITNPGQNFIYSNWSPSPYTSLLYFRLENGKFDFLLSDNSGVILRSVSTTTISVNQWYFLSATKSGQTTRLYVNNILEDTDTNPSFGTMTLNNGTDGKPSVGRYPLFGGFYYFYGGIDDLRYYNTALTTDRLTNLFNYR
jgi:hypothetical protein